jgi:hypothetical protein
VSLIFEALKKLDREKQAPERGFLVVGSGAWGAGRRVGPLPIALAIAAAGVAGFLAARWGARPGPVAPAAAAPATAVSPSAPPTLSTAPAVSPPVRTEAPARDPVALPSAAFEPKAPRVEPVEAPPVEPLALQAVSERDGQPVAILNGQLVRVGDVLAGARILRIAPDSVEIERDGRRVTIGF